jgi:hypothetical protein
MLGENVMVDFIYNVVTRPIANEPDSKDVYHVPRAQKDPKAKAIEDQEPRDHRQQQQHQAEQEEKLDEKLEPKQKGKGKYIDDQGVEHLDIFV